MKCGGRTNSEYDEDLPKDLSVEDILVYSSNIGSVKIGQIIGIDKMKEFLNQLGMLDQIEFDIQEVGSPLPFKWGDCKLKNSFLWARDNHYTNSACKRVRNYSKWRL